MLQGKVHPPEFRLTHRLSDWPECWLHVHCHGPRCNGRSATPAVKLLRARCPGDPPFSEVVARLRCEMCGQRPAPVFLCASPHRTALGGPAPGWTVELVPPPR